MYIRQLFAVAALLLIGTNSMPQPQETDTTPTTTTAGGMSGPPTGSFSGHSKEGKEEYVSWKSFIGGYPGGEEHEYAPPGVGNGGSGETTTTTGGGTFSTALPPSNSTDTTDTTDTTSSTTTATDSTATDTSAKLRRAIAF